MKQAVVAMIEREGLYLAISPFSDYNVSVFNALDHMRRFLNGNA